MNRRLLRTPRKKAERLRDMVVKFGCPGCGMKSREFSTWSDQHGAPHMRCYTCGHTE